MGRHLSPRYGQVILVSGYPVLTAVNWSQHWCAICVQYQSSCALNVRLNIGCLVVRTDGRAVYGHVITKFSGMGRLTYAWCSAGALRAPELRYDWITTILEAQRILRVVSHFNLSVLSVAKCRGSWVVGRGRGSWVVGVGVDNCRGYKKYRKKHDKVN